MKYLTALLPALFFFNTLGAQTQAGESVAGLTTGFSLASALFKLSEIDGNVDASAPPALQFTYDYALTNRFSLGGGISYQQFKLAYSDYGETKESFDVRLSRFNLAARALIHYGNSETLDMYSGLRAGLSNWSAKGGSSATDYEPPKVNGIVFAPQLILFGMRGYVTENLGFGGEVGIGAPHYFSLGVNYRF